MREELIEKIKKVSPDTFDELALEVFRYQATCNELYARFLELLKVDPLNVRHIKNIPCLPIGFFKTFDIQCGEWLPEQIFTSSGTTGQQSSRHLVRNLDWYKAIALRGFEQFYGPIGNYCVLALLPSYLERSGSSLVFMADDFIRRSGHTRSGFYLYDLSALADAIKACQAEGTPVLLLGVSFALWDLAVQFPMPLDGVIVMETGGMKGRKRELTRDELHLVFKNAFHIETVHSEYGMTELLSQAYSQGKGLFYPSHTMRVFTRDVSDPLSPQQHGKTGVINVIDLANIDSISFIATEDLGKTYADGSFEVLGRLDASDLRGCNLMVAGQA